MNNYHLNTVRALCTDLQDRIDDLLSCRMHNDCGNAKYPKESGAVRRTSMELTRALADLRRSRD